MAGDDPVVDDLAGAILDGSPVDWVDAERRIDASSEDVLRSLRILATVADLQREVQGSTPPSPTQPAPPAPVDSWGHLRLLELIGRGSFGDVYRAWDPKLDREVALKLLWAGGQTDLGSSSIIDEGRLLARVRHANVVTIHGADQIAGRIGLWMEFVRGKSLDELLRDGEAFSGQAVAEIGIALCGALSAVHGAGLLHRDIKAQNVIRADDGRTVLMDFGTGREAGRSGSDLAGTPLYMAPEVLGGQPASEQSDIYSLGVLLYHVLTNAYPVNGRTIDEVRKAHDGSVRASLRDARPDLPARLARIIERAIDPVRARRYASAEALGADLRSATARPRGLAKALVTILVAAAVVIAWTQWGPSGDGTHRSVAVIGFRNTSGDIADAWLSTALSEMLTRELAAGGVVRAASHGDVARMTSDLGFVDANGLGPDALRRIGRHLGSQIVIFGSYVALKAQATRIVRLDLTVREAATGKFVGQWTETGTETGLFDLAAHAGTRLRYTLGMQNLSASDADALRASRPASPQAMRQYAEGLQKLRQFDGAAARLLFEQTVAADPAFAPGHAALGEAWVLLHNPTNARAAFAKAFELSKSLSREEQLVIEAQYRRHSAGTAAMLKIQESLVEFFPDRIEYAVRLASRLNSSNRRQDALTAIERLRSVSAEAREDPRVDLVEAQVTRLLGDPERARAAAARSATASAARGARGLLARARQEEAYALDALGQHAEAARAFHEASELYAALGDLRGKAAVQRSLGLSLRRQGSFVRARHEYEQASEALAAAGSGQESLAVLHDIAFMLEAHGDLDGAKTTSEQRVLPRFPDSQTSGIEYSIGRLQFLRGDLTSAYRTLRTTLDRRQQSLLARIDGLLAMAALQLEQGDLAGARRSGDAALALCRDNPAAARLISAARHTLASVLAAAGDISAARLMLDEVGLGRDGSANDLAARHALASAVVALEDGHAAEAAAPVRKAAEFFGAQGLPDERAMALGWLARLLVAGPDGSEAARLVEQARALTRGTQNMFVRTAIAITDAEVAAALREPAAVPRARAGLEAAMGDARRFGLVAQQLSLRLALGTLEIASGQIAAGRSRLSALERDARARGFGLIARKAAASRRAAPRASTSQGMSSTPLSGGQRKRAMQPLSTSAIGMTAVIRKGLQQAAFVVSMDATRVGSGSAGFGTPPPGPGSSKYTML